jgi:hypothetical protein
LRISLATWGTRKTLICALLHEVLYWKSRPIASPFAVLVRRTHHAGVSYWRGHGELNGRSIGIEIVNPEHQAGYRDFRAPPLDAVCDLCLSILSRHAIPARSDRPTQDTELSFAVRQEE